MTDEQIKQNAEEYAEEHAVRTDGGGWEEEYDYEEQEAAYIAGVHSLDEEIEQLEERIKVLDMNLVEQQLENQQLRNPWISVEERLPEGGKDILLSYDDGNIVRVGCVRIGDINFIKNHIQHYMCWMETPKPELKKGDKQ